MSSIKALRFKSLTSCGAGKQSRKLIRSAFSCALFIGFSPNNHAYAQTSATLSVSLTVADSCNISSVNHISFSSQTAGQTLTSVQSQAGSVTILCAGSSTAVSVNFSNGLNSDGSSRRLQNASGGSYLSYGLEFSIDGTNYAPVALSHSGVVVTPGSGGTTYNLRASLPSGTSFVRSGTYSDQLTVSISF
jgi:spore coat protein U-like protein